MNILSFNTEAEAETAAKKIWSNVVRDAVANGAMVVNGGDPHTDVSSLTDDEVAVLKLCGKRKGVDEMTEGQTLKYTTVTKAYEVSKWYFPAVDAEFMTGVVGHTEETLPESWLPPPPL